MSEKKRAPADDDGFVAEEEAAVAAAPASDDDGFVAEDDGFVEAGGELAEEVDGFTKAINSLDYARARSLGPALAKALEAMTGHDVYREGETPALNTLSKGYPGSAELFERAGLMTHWPVAREVVGFGADILTDPSTYVTAGSSALAKLAAKMPALSRALKVARGVGTPLSTAAQPAGKWVWKKAFKELDAEAVRTGSNKIRPSDILTNPVDDTRAWTREGLNERIGIAADNRLAKRDTILKAADETGVKLNPDVARARIDEVLSELKPLSRLEAASEKSAYLKSAADKLDAALRPKTGSMYAEGYQGLSPSLGTKAKTLVTEDVPRNQYAHFAGTPVAKEAELLQGTGLRAAVEDAAVRSGVEGGKDVGRINEELGSLIAGQKREAAELAKELISPTFSQVDGPLLFLAPGAYGAKQAAKLGMRAGPQSVLGRNLALGSNYIRGANIAGRRGIWSLMSDREIEELTSEEDKK